MLTVKQLEQYIGSKAADWAGACYGVAARAAEMIEGARPVYGHYLGYVHPRCMFAPAAKAGFVQHGWVALADGRILDPTRWVFEKRRPYIHVGPAGSDYDEGGNRFRAKQIGPAPEFDFDDKAVNVTPSMLPSDAWNYVESILGLDKMFMDDEYTPGDITVPQLQWLANQDPRSMQGHAKPIFELLERLKMRGFVPYDNWVMVKEGRAR